MSQIETCYHCGNDVTPKEQIIFDDKKFCCQGCQTVYEIFSQNDLCNYYEITQSPGATPQDIAGKYDFLDNLDIVSKMLDFDEDYTKIVTLDIPQIHCSSCIWILENLQKLNPGISKSVVNFPKKNVRITFYANQTSLKAIVLLLSSVGYEPYISLEKYNQARSSVDRSLVYRAGIAFFSFGNNMLLSFPEYFETNEFWIEQYKPFFRWLIFGLSLPPFFYSASIYYVSAYKSLKNGFLNIDVPIALGIIVMFVRSTFDIVFDYGQGFFDSMTGLIFFMLIGKLFQRKTYEFLSFERDYKSYFPIAVTKIATDKKEMSVQVYDIKKGDRLLIRNHELIPVDGILISDQAQIDYSFVTGESVPVRKSSGDKLFAGGKQVGQAIEFEVLNELSQSYLTQLWSNDVFSKSEKQNYKTITDKISQYFTPILLFIAVAGFLYWVFIDVQTAFNVFTAVLIVACPCALALTAPFTLGNVLRIMGYKKLYLKNAQVIEKMAQIDTIVFDKTGTITTNEKSDISFDGQLNDIEVAIVKNCIKSSNHPLSRRLYDYLPSVEMLKIDQIEEIVGKGIKATFNHVPIKIGSSSWVKTYSETQHKQTHVHIAIDGIYKGKFVFKNQYRKGLTDLFNRLNKNYELYILSGDNEGERPYLEKLLPNSTILVFNQKPDEKLDFIKSLQSQNKKVMMIGDGLNDAGALAQSQVGWSISENINVFSPACDGILDAREFTKIDKFLNFSKNGRKTIYMSFVLSLLYNLVGLSFAVTGQLSPLVAAIIMPLSTVTIISFVTLMSNWYAKSLSGN